MTTSRTDIEKALDEIISNEEGMRFQGLAVVLTKGKYPEFIASERKNDLGLDAYLPARFAPDKIGKGLACSLTATITKIKGDIAGKTGFIKYVDDVKVLFFATPKAVTNSKKKSWSETVSKEFGIELHVLSREDIITDLITSANLSLCQSHLRIPVGIEPTIQEIIKKTNEATVEILNSWLAHPRLAHKPMMALQSVKLNDDGLESHEILGHADLKQALKESRRIVLEAPAGRGKTTTLIQIAEQFCKTNEIAFLVDLPAWVESGKDILEFIAQAPPFRSRKIDASALSQIYGSVPCSFLLNGWNEISGNSSDKAVRAIADLERNYFKTGILVATRNHPIQPPLPGSFKAKLLSLNRKQRSEYLHRSIGSHASALIAQLEGDRVLDDLTRTPLILAEVATIFSSGQPIPKTKSGVIKVVMRLIEESHEHKDHLASAPLQGNSHSYLAELAIGMTARGAVTVEDAAARNSINIISQRLKADGQIASVPEPAEVLKTLCAHHVLERIQYPTGAYKFQHQQFQEWYASAVLEKRLLELVEKNEPALNRDFMREYLNESYWEEPLLMIAENMGYLIEELSNDVLVKAGRILVESALEVDPIFAAALARLCKMKVWKEVRDAMGSRLRSWYKDEDEEHKQCAIAGMFASGSEDFKDILLPLLTNKDHQIRLKSYRSSGTFHVSSLGPNWKQTVDEWEEDQRADFIGEVVDDFHSANIAEEFAKTDSSVKVRTSALRALDWIGATDALNRVLLSYDDNAFEELLSKRILSEIPEELWPRAVAVYNGLLQKTYDPKERLRIRLALSEIGVKDENGIKDDLTKWPSEKINDGEEILIKKAIELVKKNNSEWISHWTARRIAEGFLWREGWTDFVSCIPKELRQELLKKIETEHLQHNDISAISSILAATADEPLAGQIFSTLCSLKQNEPPPSQKAEVHWAIKRQLEDFFRAIPPNIAVAGMLNTLSSEIAPIKYGLALTLFGRAGTEDPDLRAELTEKLREELRRFFKNGLSFVLQQDDFDGGLKAGLSTVLSRIGLPEDMNDLSKLIRADIQRRQRSVEARRKGERGPTASAMSWSNWHIRAVEGLDSQTADKILLEIFPETEYEGEVSEALIRLARTKNFQTSGFRRKNYEALWKARAGQAEMNLDEKRRLQYSDAITKRIVAIKEVRLKNEKPDSFNGRLKKLAFALAVLDGEKSLDLILEILALPGDWDGHTRAETLEVLLFNGVLIKADAVLKVLDSTIDRITKPGEVHVQQNRYLLQQCLSLLPLVEPPSVGILRIKEVLSAVNIQVHELREILNALGHSRCDEALNLLLEIATTYGTHSKNVGSEWIDAITTLDTAESKKFLMSFVDFEITRPVGKQHLEYYEKERVGLRIAELSRTDKAIRERVYTLCSTAVHPQARLLLGAVVTHLGTSEALIAGLNLIRDRLNPSIPQELSSGLQNAFLRKRPHGTSHVYSIEPRSANEIRSILFKMMSEDDSRKRSAWTLLGQIESWRLEYGRPNNEPRHPNYGSNILWPEANLTVKQTVS